MSDDEPGAAERAAERLREHLEGIEEADTVRVHNGTVDFTVGDVDLWPRYHADDELNVVRSSSVSFEGLLPEDRGVASQGDPRMGSNVHLPPAAAGVWEELESEADFPDEFALVNGSFQLGSLMPPPDGVCTPHLLVVEDASVEEVKDAVDELFRLYESVYDGGEEVIKEQP